MSARQLTIFQHTLKSGINMISPTLQKAAYIEGAKLYNTRIYWTLAVKD